MNPTPLLIVSAFLELGAGAVMLLVPSKAAEGLMGAGLDSAPGVAMGRFVGVALLAIGVGCAVEAPRGGPRRGIVAGLLTYDLGFVALFLMAALVDGLHGPMLWAGALLHSALAIWCLLCLRADAPPPAR